jgi:hypothetical protein
MAWCGHSQLKSRRHGSGGRGSIRAALYIDVATSGTDGRTNQLFSRIRPEANALQIPRAFCLSRAQGHVGLQDATRRLGVGSA